MWLIFVTYVILMLHGNTFIGDITTNKRENKRGQKYVEYRIYVTIHAPNNVSKWSKRKSQSSISNELAYKSKTFNHTRVNPLCLTKPSRVIMTDKRHVTQVV